MNDFDSEVMRRKSLARQASYRKCGSKSKKCSMSTDHMTKKQWLERCGEIVTYQIGKPMPWEEFKQMPIHIQKEYLLNMIQKYSTTASDLARLFGISSTTVTKYCGNNEIGISFSPGKRMPKDKRAEFEKLFAEEKESVPVSVTAPAEQPSIPAQELHTDMSMTDFSLCFQGVICPEMITNSIIAMLRPGSKARIEIKCSILE